MKASVRRARRLSVALVGAAALVAATTSPSAARPASPRVAPTAPSAPTIGSVRGGRGVVTVTWSAPTSDGGSPITGYVVTPYRGSTAQPATTSNTTDTSVTIPGLSPDQAFTFKVAAKNAVGTGPQSGGSAVAIPRWTSLAEFTQEQARDVLGRPATAPEMVAEQTALTSGATPASYVQTLRRSTDATSIIDPTTRLYFAYFLRIPDIGGLTHWIRKKRAGASIYAISDSFATSSEFKTRYGNLTNSQFVNLVYQNVLGRAGDPGGVASWTRKLDTKVKTRGQVMVGFSESNEYKKKKGPSVDVAVTWIALLQASPDQASFTTWVTNLTTGGKTVADLAAALFADARYSARFASTSRELVDAAFAAGAIDAKTATIYRAFAAFDSPYLPAKYRGRPNDSDDPSVITNVEAIWASLTVAQRDQIEPLLHAPAYKGSWADAYRAPPAGIGSAASTSTPTRSRGTRSTAYGNPAIYWGGWASVDGPHARFWYQTDQGSVSYLKNAATVGRDAFENEIYPSFKALMKRDPKSDAGTHSYVIYALGTLRSNLGDGGDGRIDFYLTPWWPGGGGAQTEAYPEGCESVSAYVTMGAGNLGWGFTNELRNAIAHEYFHVLQYSYNLAENCKDRGIAEATATWAPDHVYPNDDFETRPEYQMQWILEHGMPNGYEDWPFFFYLARTKGPDVIRQIWEQMTSHTAWDAVDKVVGLGGSLYSFTSYLWNRGSYTDFLAAEHGRIPPNTRPRGLRPQDPQDIPTRDGTTWPDTTTGLSPGLHDGLATATLDAHVPALGAYYYHFTFDDPSARWLAFDPGTYPDPDFPDSEFNDPALRVRALIRDRTDQTWHSEDWTNGAVKCRALPDQRFDELVLVVINTSSKVSGTTGEVGHPLTKHPVEKPRIAVSNVACGGSWTGSATETTLYEGISTFSRFPQGMELTWNASYPGPPYLVYFQMPATTVEYEISGTKGTCTYSGSGTYVYPATNGGFKIRWDPFADPETVARPEGSGNLSTFIAPVQTSCPPNPPGTEGYEFTGADYGAVGTFDAEGNLSGERFHSYGKVKFSYTQVP